ncbi:MAG TPA: SRPBCC domain-containing protein [Ohtaekwangia sp.]|nr:SRPBCC domain-containing protein [Ohtaekwangia sp.]
MRSTKDFSVTLSVEQSPEQVFNAVLNVREWWQGFYNEAITGDTSTLNGVFSFRAGDGAHFTRQKLIELIPNEKVVWQVTDSELTFIKDTNEWQGTEIVFEIAKHHDKTQVRFIHRGLTPEVECFDACSSAWSMYIEKQLLALIKRA